MAIFRSYGARLYLDGKAVNVLRPKVRYVYRRGAILQVAAPACGTVFEHDDMPAPVLDLSKPIEATFAITDCVYHSEFFRLFSHRAAEAIMSAEAKPIANGN